MGREVVARESLVYLAARQHFMFKPVLLGGTQRPRKTLQLLCTKTAHNISQQSQYL
jgi:hypothetical protein